MGQEDNMGGGGSSGFSSVDLTKLTEAADERLRKLAEANTHVLFVWSYRRILVTSIGIKRQWLEHLGW
jgi:hypothetical protein